MGRTRENQGIYSLNNWEKGAAVSERRKAQLHKIKEGTIAQIQCNNPDCDTAIGQHLLNNKQCAANYNDKRFKILAGARNSFHLCLLEANFIKTRHPVLCKQKEFVYTLKLFK